MCDEIVPILGLLQAAEGHLGAGNVFLWVLKILKLSTISAKKFHKQCSVLESKLCMIKKHTNVDSFHSMPFCLFASVYEKPSTWPVFRPKRPWRFGPILLPSPSLRVWHWAHRVYEMYERHSMRWEMMLSVDTHLEETSTFLCVSWEVS